jgi:hypothetical protein
VTKFPFSAKNGTVTALAIREIGRRIHPLGAGLIFSVTGTAITRSWPRDRRKCDVRFRYSPMNPGVTKNEEDPE